MPNTRLTRRTIVGAASRLLRVSPCQYASAAFLALAQSDAPAEHPAFLDSL